MTDDTQKKQLEPLNLFPVSGKATPKSSPDKPPKILPIEFLTHEEYLRAYKEGLRNRPQHPRATEDEAS